MNGLEDISRRTDGRGSLGLQRLRRETKKQTIPMHQFEEKWENLIFEGIKGDKRRLRA